MNKRKVWIILLGLLFSSHATDEYLFLQEEDTGIPAYLDKHSLTIEEQELLWRSTTSAEVSTSEMYYNFLMVEEILTRVVLQAKKEDGLYVCCFCGHRYQREKLCIAHQKECIYRYDATGERFVCIHCHKVAFKQLNACMYHENHRCKKRPR